MTLLDRGTLANRRFILGITGSIAAYKAPAIVRGLRASGALVRVILTESAQKFVGASVFTGLGAEVFTDMWEGPGEPHVSLASWAEIFLIAPTTADTIAKLRMGRATDLLTATALCFDGTLMLAPAMHPRMWLSPATCENVKVLKNRGVQFIGPAHGEVASGDKGPGRLVEPEIIVAEIARKLIGQGSPLQGRHLVITAGPTREAIDPVRALTNHSSGKMGYALAAVALARGAKVTLISGPVALSVPFGAEVVNVESALEMQAALNTALGPGLENADVLIMAAAVSDYRPKSPSEEKLKRTGDDLILSLKPNPDILKEVGSRRQGLRPVLVGFALETVYESELVFAARQKLIQKQVDLIVANHADDSLGREDNRVQLVAAQDCIALPAMEKTQVAAKIIDWVQVRLIAPPAQETLT